MIVQAAGGGGGAWDMTRGLVGCRLHPVSQRTRADGLHDDCIHTTRDAGCRHAVRSHGSISRRIECRRRMIETERMSWAMEQSGDADDESTFRSSGSALNPTTAAVDVRVCSDDRERTLPADVRAHLGLQPARADYCHARWCPRRDRGWKGVQLTARETARGSPSGAICRAFPP